MTAWEPAVGDWVVVTQPARYLAPLTGHVGRVAGVVHGTHYAWVCKFTDHAPAHMALHEIAPATQEQLAKAQLTQLEGL